MIERLFFRRPFRSATSEKEVARARNDGPREHRVAGKTNRSIALVCDWLTTPGGAEKVLLELHRMYPDAPIYTSQYRKKGIDWFNDATVKTGWLQIFPAALRKFLSPLRQIYFSHLDLSDYDLVISVTGAEAKSVKFAPDKTHLCYCHAPTQYYWQFYDRYVENPGFGFAPLDAFVRFFFKLLVKPLRKADYRAAQKPTEFITISRYSASQIQKYYHRPATVIAPPVDIATFSTNPPKKSTKRGKLSTNYPQISTEKSTKSTDFSTTFPQLFHSQSQNFPQYYYDSDHPDQPPKIICPDPPAYFIISCRQVNWKRVDLAIKACLATESPLLVVGDGPERHNLLKLSGDSTLIKFLPWISATELAQYLHGAKAYLFPSLEPFGIAAIEALAAGCPVIAFAEGGSTDFIKVGKNGLTFPKQTADSLASAIRKFNQTTFDRSVVSESARKFDTAHFVAAISSIVQSTTAPKSPQKPSKKGTKK